MFLCCHLVQSLDVNQSGALLSSSLLQVICSFCLHVHRGFPLSLNFKWFTWLCLGLDDPEFTSPVQSPFLVSLHFFNFQSFHLHICRIFMASFQYLPFYPQALFCIFPHTFDLKNFLLFNLYISYYILCILFLFLCFLFEFWFLIFFPFLIALCYTLTSSCCLVVSFLEFSFCDLVPPTPLIASFGGGLYLVT